MKLPDCAYRHAWLHRRERWFCAHPRVTVSEGIVTPSLCKNCTMATAEPVGVQRPLPRQLQPAHAVPCCLFRGELLNGHEPQSFACHHPCHATTDLDHCRLCDDYARQLLPGDVKTWSVGITTAPRRCPTLATMLTSLRNAGWEEWRLFAEPGSEIPNDVGCDRITSRARTMGAFSNWLLGLMELVLDQPDADAYFLCQDDAVFFHGLRAYLEQHLWPGRTLGVVSVYCAAVHDPGGGPRFAAIDAGWDTCGAVALIFPNAVAKAMLVDPIFLGHRLRGPRQGRYQIDSIVGLWCQRASLPFLIHTPSLVQHIGETSSIFRASCANDAPHRSAHPWDVAASGSASLGEVLKQPCSAGSVSVGLQSPC